MAHDAATNDLRLWKLLEGREVESGLGEGALEEAGPVLHLLEPVFTSVVS